MISLGRFLVLQALRCLGVTLARSERSHIPALRSLMFYFLEYLGLGLSKLGAIFITNNMGPTQLGRVV